MNARYVVNVVWKLGIPSLTIWEDVVEVQFDMLLMLLQLLMINCKYLDTICFLRSNSCHQCVVTHDEDSDNETDDSESTDGMDTPRDAQTPRGETTPMTTPRRFSISERPRRSSSADTITLLPNPQGTVPRRSSSFSEVASPLDTDKLRLEAEQKIASLTDGLARMALEEQEAWETSATAITVSPPTDAPSQEQVPEGVSEISGFPPQFPPPSATEPVLPPLPVQASTQPTSPQVPIGSSTNTQSEFPTSLPTTCFADGDDFGDVIDLAQVHSYRELETQMLEKFPDNTGKKLLLYFVGEEGKKVKITPTNFSQALLLSGVVKEVRIRGN